MSPKKSAKTIVIISSSVTLIVLAVYWLILSFAIKEPDQMGQFGDSFGALTAFFSGLAFVGMIYALTLQIKELSFQREELKLTREELTRTTATQAEQAKQLLLTAQINGLAAIVQGRYSYAAALGANSSNRLSEALIAEEELIKMLNKTGNINIELPKFNF